MMRGTLYDGASGHPFAVEVGVGESKLELSTEGGWRESVDAAVLRGIDGAGVRLARTDLPGWRLVLPEEARAAIAPLLPRAERYGGWIDRVGLGKAALLFGAATAAVLAIGYTAPHWLAPHIPPRWERDLGEAMVGDFGDLRCRGGEGQAALNAMVERLEPGATRPGPGQIKIAALDVAMFNAAALPGGHVVLFRGALEASDAQHEAGDGGEALAGIVAHEIAHVRRRHVTQAMIRELGIGALIRLMAGDLGANASQLVGLRYTRANEAEADADAIAMLRRARIDPRGTARLFAELAAEEREDGLLAAEFLQSHPGSRDRGKRFAASYRADLAYRPALAPGAAGRLYAVCGTPD